MDGRASASAREDVWARNNDTQTAGRDFKGMAEKAQGGTWCGGFREGRTMGGRERESSGRRERVGVFRSLPQTRPNRADAGRLGGSSPIRCARAPPPWPPLPPGAPPPLRSRASQTFAQRLAQRATPQPNRAASRPVAAPSSLRHAHRAVTLDASSISHSRVAGASPLVSPDSTSWRRDERPCTHNASTTRTNALTTVFS